MIRTKHMTISILTTIAVMAALAVPAFAYESVNAATHQASSDESRSVDYTSVNAAVSESAQPARTVEPGSINAILGSRNVAEPVVETTTVSASSSFDWDDALVGAGGALLLVLFTGGTMVLVRRRRSPRVQPTV